MWAYQNTLLILVSGSSAPKPATTPSDHPTNPAGQVWRSQNSIRRWKCQILNSFNRPLEQGWTENWAQIVVILSFWSFLPINWVGVWLWMSIKENCGQTTQTFAPISPPNCCKICVAVVFHILIGLGVSKPHFAHPWTETLTFAQKFVNICQKHKTFSSLRQFGEF